MRWLGILGVLAYRVFVRPFMRRTCLFHESCSTYAIRTLREFGLWRALPLVRARVRSCRLPAAACFVIGADGRARLLTAEGPEGAQPPPIALALLASHAEQVTIGDAEAGAERWTSS